jgi:DinB superfamily
MKWFEREFDFQMPVGVFPCIVERLRGTPARLEEILRPLAAPLLIVKPGGAWSIKEQVGHLIDLEELHDGRLDDFVQRLGTLRPADLSNRKTHEAGYNDVPVADLLARFRAVRTEFVRRLEALTEEEAGGVSALHPRLQKPMRVIDMTLFVAEHDDHHIAAIREIAGQKD